MSHGGTFMPEHFQLMVEIVAIINRSTRVLNGFALATDNSQLVERVNGKKKDIIGIEEKIIQEQTATIIYETNFIETNQPVQTMASIYANEKMTEKVYARQELCMVLWGVIPYQYVMSTGIEVRNIFQTLRVIPAPGFNLISFLQEVVCEGSKFNRQVDKDYEQAHKLFQRVLNQESLNMGLASIDIMSPITVKDCRFRVSIASVLSPYILLRKMLRFIPGGYCGLQASGTHIVSDSLCIHGMPPLTCADENDAALEFYDLKQTAYLEALYLWNLDFSMKTSEASDAVISDIFPRNAVTVSEAVTMVFYPSFDVVQDIHSRRVHFPLLVSTILTNYKFVMCHYENEEAVERWRQSRSSYIKAQCGTDVNELNHVNLYQQYRLGGAVDFPCAGKYVQMRRSMESLLSKENLDVDIETYVQYIKYCNIILKEQQVDGFFMSERVRVSAEILRRSYKTMASDIKKSLGRVKDALNDFERECFDLIMHDPMMLSAYLWQAGLSHANSFIRATGINLGLIQTFLICDVLCFLGMHNPSWTWAFFPTFVCGGGGHLRAHTDDGVARSDSLYLAKAPSVGFSSVVIKSVNTIFLLAGSHFVDLASDVTAKLLEIKKIDRLTRVAIEERCALMIVNGVVVKYPDPTLFMSPIYFDEFSRSINADAIDRLITSGLPRDQAGAGVTQKSVESKTRGPREQQITQPVNGMTAYILGISQNRNCISSVVGESYNALITGSVATSPPSAQISNGMLCIGRAGTTKRHCNNMHNSSSTQGESKLPDRGTTEHFDLTWLYSILPMNCRSLGLLNKMSMTNINVNDVEQQVHKWFGNIVSMYFEQFLSTTLYQSFWRIMNGYMARNVAASLIQTNLLNMMTDEDVEDANHETLVQMEGGISLHALDNGLLDVLSHMVDFNVILVNQLVREKLKTPVLPLAFLHHLFEEDNALNQKFPAERQTLGDWMRANFVMTAERRMQHGYVYVPTLGYVDDYQSVEQYLELYCSIIQHSFQTYRKAIERSKKVLDLSDFLCLRHSMLSCSYKYVGINTSEFYQNDSELAGCVTQNFVHIIEKDNKINKVYVHLAQHLLLTSLLGEDALHSDNIFTLGQNVFRLILEEAGVQQQIPSGLVCNTFQSRYDKVSPVLFQSSSSNYYMLRSTNDFKAWSEGRITELNGLLGCHPTEDIMHMGAWIQMYKMFMGKLPAAFEPHDFPLMRIPELVPGRIYPMQSNEEGFATICICPEGRNYALFSSDDYHICMETPSWGVEVVQKRKFTVAPLIFRPNALVCVEGRLGLVMPRPSPSFSALEKQEWEDHYDTVVRPCVEENFLGLGGRYEVLFEDGVREEVFWTRVHASLLRLGTFIYVRSDLVQDAQVPPDADYVRGWLRYADESTKEYVANKVYVCVRVVKAKSTSFGHVITLALDLDQVVLELPAGKVVKIVEPKL